ncbi:alcohol dehydrogenase (NADP(+)) [Malassezia cuniculi]|uniref:Alcohol dehydrogenase (NADP(+)) n=1 Tax=Malassezia cuniculi TaxID=948313 RepID=A0AAF0JD94_9BASI|nr:alcohol dehydrogenase (NADP(+)) [Malassezia cuniculi]
MSNPQIELGTVFKGSPSGRAVKAEGGVRELRPHEVVIDIAYSGLCGTDLHFRKKDMVLGHEGVGIISQVGAQVTNVKVGDRVGWGYNHDSCGYCDPCLDGWDIFCPEKKMYGMADLDIGGFGDRAVINSLFVHKIPDALSLRDAAPLQCGGITVFAALVNAKVSAQSRVGILGIGGLGHLAIQYAAKMGCEVVVFSSTNSKKEQALELGATEFVATKENPKLEGVKPLDVLLVTASFQPDWNLYFKAMRPEGVIVPLTVSFEEMKHPYADIVAKQLNVHGSVVGRRLTHRQMLEFSARHKVVPIVEELPMTEEGLNEAMERLDRGDVRYRFVLKSQRTDAA